MILKNANILDLKTGTVQTGMDIAITGDTITAIGVELHSDDKDYRDMSHRLVTPTFTNGHTHLGMAMMRGYGDDFALQTWLETKIWPFEAKLTSEDIYWASKLSLLENLYSGVGTIVDMYDSVGYVVQAGRELGMKGLYGKGVMDLSGDGDKKLQRFVKDYTTYGNANQRVILAPHSVYTCSESFLKDCLELGTTYGGVLHTHVLETEKEKEDFETAHGMSVVDYFGELGYLDVPLVAAHCVHMTERDINTVKGCPFIPVHNPVSNLKLGSGVAPVGRWLGEGIDFLFGTDSVASNNNQNLIKELQVGTLVAKNAWGPETIGSLDMLRRAFDFGDVLGFNHGGVDVGKKADLICFDLESLHFTPANSLLSALTYSADIGDITDVLIDGEYKVKDRESCFDDEQVRYEVSTRTRRILNEV
ncbi:amidohydrolase [Peptoniphilus equinus]|uniref:Amidohydrolase n=1 Tax=Peptoniphilus equinus TaxID=3016343 RepID=A0ABY7QRV6_9FIRM|nr:amidohydrolase [Peptoniphilus equinus]WBW49522.1 amidohydrolase [Peptoniphilus equinus]